MALTTISLYPKLKEQISEFGNAGESFPQVLEKLLKSANERLFHDFIMSQDSIPIEEALKRAERKWCKE